MSRRTVAFVFPGQGSQRVGMLDQLQSCADVARLLDAAEALSGLPLRRIAAEGPAETLAGTRAAQPLLYLADLAHAFRLRDTGIQPAMVAGHSLGELAALAYAGAFSAEAGLELVCERSRLMAATAESTPGGMAAVLGMSGDAIADAIAGLAGVWVANDNVEGQVVISGTHQGLEQATRALSEAGARKIVPLPVTGAFHSPLMAPAAESFATLLRETAFSDTAVPVLQNTDPIPASEAATLRHRLEAQIIAPVRWRETMDSLRALHVDSLVECGPGAVLAGLARRVDGLDAFAVEVTGIDGIVEAVGA